MKKKLAKVSLRLKPGLYLTTSGGIAELVSHTMGVWKGYVWNPPLVEDSKEPQGLPMPYTAEWADDEVKPKTRGTLAICVYADDGGETADIYLNNLVKPCATDSLSYEITRLRDAKVLELRKEKEEGPRKPHPTAAKLGFTLSEDGERYNIEDPVDGSTMSIEYSAFNSGNAWTKLYSLHQRVLANKQLLRLRMKSMDRAQKKLRAAIKLTQTKDF
jgi:hypothetical protein